MLPSSSNEEVPVSSKVLIVSIVDDVLLEIFSYLPADVLIGFQIICKSWFNLITSNIRNSTFCEKHTHHLHQHPPHAITTLTTTTTSNLPTILCSSTGTRPIPFHKLYSLNNTISTSFKKKKIEAIDVVYPFKSPSIQIIILGSCNGLLCIKVIDRKTLVLCLWNPTTTEFKHVPAAPVETSVSVESIMYGFGFDRIIKDYKLVQLMLFTNEDAIIKVYTLGTDSWKTVSVENERPLYSIIYKSSKAGLYVDGALHWMLGSTRIYSYNIEEEEFGEVPIPEECPKKVMVGARLQVLRGCLCIFNSYVDHPKSRVFEVWMMMHYGVKESWTKLLSVNMDLGWARTGPWKHLKPLWICNNGEVLIGSDGVHCSSSILVVYDPNNNKIIESISVQGIPINRTKEMVHIRSFVSLKSGTYVDQEESKKKKRKRKGVNQLGIA